MSPTWDHRPVPRGLIAGAYLAAVLLVPILIDAFPAPFALTFWLGSSFLAGALVADRWMYLVPVVGCVILLACVLAGAVDRPFFNDALSAMAMLFLLAGEIVALALGTAVDLPRLVRNRRAADRLRRP